MLDSCRKYRRRKAITRGKPEICLLGVVTAMLGGNGVRKQTGSRQKANTYYWGNYPAPGEASNKKRAPDRIDKISVGI